MLEEKPPARSDKRSSNAGKKGQIRTIVLVVIIVIGIGGGIALLLGVGGGSSGNKSNPSTVSDLGTGTVPTGNTDDFLAGNVTPTYPR